MKAASSETLARLCRELRLSQRFPRMPPRTNVRREPSETGGVSAASVAMRQVPNATGLRPTRRSLANQASTSPGTGTTPMKRQLGRRFTAWDSSTPGSDEVLSNTRHWLILQLQVSYGAKLQACHCAGRRGLYSRTMTPPLGLLVLNWCQTRAKIDAFGDTSPRTRVRVVGDLAHPCDL